MENSKGNSFDYNSTQQKHQLMRFCLYGFLKNQLYFESFLILAFLEKGLSFLQIGILISFRAVSVNIVEIPSGAAADVWGRKRSMVLSMLAYICSFAIFALAENYWVYFSAMAFFAIGDAFRTGTHKAMIFDWLHHFGRENEKTAIYGLTRSWSKIGSAVSVIFAAVIVISTNSYAWIFWFSILPYLMNIINFAFYPRFLDGHSEKLRNKKQVIKTLKSGLALCLKKRTLRSLILENICFEGFYSSAKEYLQPLLKSAAVALPVMLSFSGRTRTAVLVAITYAVLNILSSVASRQSHKIAKLAGSEYKLSILILLAGALSYLLVALGAFGDLIILPIAAFLFLSLLLNVWKPVFVSRFYDLADKQTAATTLSISNQSKSLAVVLIAPLLGWMVDTLSTSNTLLYSLWPIAAAGLLFSLLGLLFHFVSD